MKWLSIVLLMVVPFMAPTAESAGLVTCSGPDCNFCTFIAMVNNLVEWLVGFLTLAAVLAMVYAGFKLVVSAGDQGAMTDAKKMMTNIVIGFVIVLSAWLIVDTLMKALVDPSLKDSEGNTFGPWNEINANQCGGINTPSAGGGDEDTQMFCSNDNADEYFVTVPTMEQCELSRTSYINAHPGTVMNACHVCTDADF